MVSDDRWSPRLGGTSFTDLAEDVEQQAVEWLMHRPPVIRSAELRLICAARNRALGVLSLHCDNLTVQLAAPSPGAGSPPSDRRHPRGLPVRTWPPTGGAPDRCRRIMKE
jgi:hypothetical protein